MPKQTKYVLMEKCYPFSQSRQAFQSGLQYQVKKVIQYDSEPRFVIKQKIRILKSLGFHNLIGLQSSISEENAIILFFQCIPYQLTKEIESLSEEVIGKIYKEMIQLCNCLASRSIVHDLEVNRVGLDKRYNVKYFLGVDFKVDKGIDKDKKKQAYKSLIDQFFMKICKNGIKDFHKPEEAKDQNVLKVSKIDQNNQNGHKFLINVKKVLNFDVNRERRILKKSSILDSKQQQLKARKASNRFTFNNHNHIQLPINEKSDAVLQRQLQNKPVKIEELTVRINKLKNYMKEVTGKMNNRVNVSPIKMGKNVGRNEHNPISINIINRQQLNSHSPHRANTLTPNNFSKFQKKIAEIKTSKLMIPSEDIQKQKSYDMSQEREDHKCNLAKNLQQGNNQRNYKSQKNSEKQNLKAIYPLQSPTHDEGTKKNFFDLVDEDRQHKQYLLLANKDKYCEQFMNFLQDNDGTSLKTSMQCPVPEEQIRISSPFQQFQKSIRKKNVLLRQNLKTQSSENTLQIQNRVQKVIRSSLKIINGLRSRQTIHAQ